MPGFFALTFTKVNVYSSHILFTLLLVAMVVFSIATKKLTSNAALTGAAMAICIYTGASLTGVAMLGAFFMLGTGATAWRRNKKEDLSPSFTHTRNAWQVVANSGVAAICGLLAVWSPALAPAAIVMMAGSLSTATADTLSSELGTLYGRRFFNIVTLKKDVRGLDGVISVEGLFIGLLGSCVIAIIFWAGNYNDAYVFLIIVIAGTVGNLSDSVLGALLERKGLLKNDAVNFLATAIGAITAGALYRFPF